MKILLQKIWRSTVGWDDVIKDEPFEDWLVWIQLLQKIGNIQIPRCYSMKSGPAQEVQLHTFVDASENAYAAVSYFRILNADHIETAIVGAKTKVTPQIPISIPRLELQAVTLGARLANSICSLLAKIKPTTISTICCLSYLRNFGNYGT